MSQTENIFTKSLVSAIFSSLCFIIAVFLVYSVVKHPLPNLLLLSVVSFPCFYLARVTRYKIQQNRSK
ncbi:hypothetical protein [Bacillus cereus group sp. BfR-BA-01380]|uniref:hypothetical protein n=1 Tax=Bacillus cereus group sp. BfR-BA-01380 TaxID=2920324 RepID=UPI001F593846|nr:hypothetical protein [Bacillus cereus group sp. BfR-BA-01380]